MNFIPLLLLWDTALYRHVKECEDIRRTMVPVDLIKRVSMPVMGDSLA